jgi:hypothetical protein
MTLNVALAINVWSKVLVAIVPSRAMRVVPNARVSLTAKNTKGNTCVCTNRVHVLGMARYVHHALKIATVFRVAFVFG